MSRITPARHSVRRVAAAAITVAVGAGVLAACNAPAEVQKIGDGEPKGTVEFWGRDTMSPWDEAVVKAFNESQDEVKVKYTPIADENIVSKLSTALRSGNLPDIVEIDDVSTLQYIDGNQLLDITEQVRGLDFYDSLSKPQLDLATFEDKIYGTPAVADLSVMLYNKDLFAQAGIDEPPTTYEQILDAARKIRALGPDTYGFTFAGACGGCLTFTMMPNIYAGGGNLLEGDIDDQKADIEGNEALAETLELYQTIWDEGLAPASAQSDNGSFWTQDFQAGNIGMAPAGMFGYASAEDDIKEKIGVTPLVGPNGETSTYIGGSNFAIPAKADNQSGAWEYIQFALGLEQQELAAEAGFFPTRTDLADDPAFQEKYPLLVPGLSAAPNGNAPRTLYHNEIHTQPSGPWLAMINEAVFGGDVEGAMKAGQAGFDSILTQK